MYLPEYFNQTDTKELQRLIGEYPLGTLVTHGAGGLDANHIMFEFDAKAGESGHLLTHVARANPVWREVADGDEVLVIFRGSNAYVSPNWYPSKHETQRQVPTWNYMTVHAHGRIVVRDEQRFVRGVVARLTRVHEGRTGSSHPWKMGDSPTEYIDQMLSAIVGLDIEITSMVGKWKLSQNKSDQDRAGAAAELRKRGEEEISNAMLKGL